MAKKRTNISVKSTQKKQEQAGSIAYYGPKPGLALKVVAAVSSGPGDLTTREWRSSGDVRLDGRIADEIAQHFRRHGVHTVTFVDAVIDCAHDDRNVCGCDDTIFKVSGVDPIYGEDTTNQDVILLAAAHAGVAVFAVSHLDFHELRDAGVGQV